MVTRKPIPSAPPNITTSLPANSSNAPPYPITPAPGSAKTTATGSSVYSPDLSTSPAFDLIDMTEARQRPRRDSDVSSHGTWDSDDTLDDERDTRDGFVDVPKPLNVPPSQQNLQREDAQRQEDTAADGLPAALKPGPANGIVHAAQQTPSQDETQANPWQLESKNPYLKQQQPAAMPDSSQAAWRDAPAPPALAPPLPPSQAPPAPPVELPVATTPTHSMSRLALGEMQQPGSNLSFETAEVFPVPQPPLPPLAPPPPAVPQAFPSTNPWRKASMPENREEGLVPPPGPPPKAPLSPMEPTAFLYAPPPGPPTAPSDNLFDHFETDLQPSNPAHFPADTSAAAGSGSAFAAPTAQAHQQKNENYQIKHINWFDASYTADPRMRTPMRRSPILTQNANGPCPLLALVNALVLSTPSDVDTSLVQALETRENVSLGLLLDAVFDELTSGRRGDAAHELPDISELYAFLLTLHTGMNVNPQFVASDDAPKGSLDGKHPAHSDPSKAGCFQETREMRLYSTFNIPLIHGWTPPPDTQSYQAFARSAPTFEDAQNIQFAEAELEDQLRSEGLGFAEQQTLQDIQSVKAFLNSWPTQLTDYGLDTISKTVAPGQIAILFRNDHFSTIYKEPKSGSLMTLVTDAGYSSHAEIVWESLVDVSGAASEMFSGDFRSVSHVAEDQLRNQQVPLHVVNRGPTPTEMPPPLPGPRPTAHGNEGGGLGVGGEAQRQASEQEDHDLALALQLQEEEEEQQRQADSRRRREQELSEQFLSGEERPPVPPRRSHGNTPAAGTGRIPTSPRPANPATNTRPAVSRPAATTTDPEAPPTYEQAASDRPYRPAGSTAPASRNAMNAYDALRATQRTSGSSAAGNNIAAAEASNRQRNDTNRIRRRSSGMGTMARREGYSGAQSSTGGPGQAPAYSRVPGAAGTKDAEDKCVVM